MDLKTDTHPGRDRHGPGQRGLCARHLRLHRHGASIHQVPGRLPRQHRRIHGSAPVSRTGYIGKVGEDILGDYLIAYMGGKGIDTSHILRCGDPAVRTGLSVAERMGPNRKRSDLYRCDVADLHMLPEEMDEAYIAQAGILLVSGASLSDSPAREAMFLAVEYARRSGVLVAFDPDYRAQSWHSELQTSVYYNLMMGLCDILITTREEMDVLEKAFLPGDQDDLRSAQRCFERGVSIVLIKHGEDGSTAFTSDGRTVVQKAFPSRVDLPPGGGRLLQRRFPG